MKVALVGIGKIAMDQHVPSIAASDDWELAATVSRSGTVAGVPAYTDLDTMLAENPDIETVSLCLPPVPRFEYAATCLRAGRHVMLEKPPGATLAEVHALEAMAGNRTLFATWHSRMAKGVAAAKAALAGKTVEIGHITWKENVRQWHPGQDWIFEPGGMGVLDPGINALSILTEILPKPVHLTKAVLHWEMSFTTTDHDHVSLMDGGNECFVIDEYMPQSDLGEYPALYARMAELVNAGQSDVDLSPMVHVSDIMTLGRRIIGPAFHW